MANYNKVILAGNLTRDPELRYLPQGTAVAEFSLAINRTYKNQAGENVEEVTFVEIAAYGRQGEVIAQYVKKGRPLLVEGRLKLDTWEDKQTQQKRSKMRVILEGFSFLDSNRPTEGQPTTATPPVARPKPSPETAGASPENPPVEEDDVPF